MKDETWTVINCVAFVVTFILMLSFAIVLEVQSSETESKANEMTEQWFKDMEVGK